jgi:hypothetical protein
MAVLDAFLSTLGIVLGFWLVPDKVTQIMILVGLWQGVAIAVIISVTVEDVQAYKAGVHPSQLKANSAPHAG